MALTQTRPYEEDLYVQLDPGDPGYIDPADLQYLVDHESWDRPKRLPGSMFGQAGGTLHIEKDKFGSLSSHSVSVTFETAFTASPVGETKVYRMIEVSSGKWRKQDVLWGFNDANQPANTGFALTIDSLESLTGIVVEYLYQ